MKSKEKQPSVDVGAVFAQAASQFRGLNAKEPGQWPLLPKVAAWLAATAAVVVACWFALLSGATDELQAERDREPALKQDYVSKLAQAVNLGELRKQKLQVQEYVTQLEKQLPGKAEMDALLSDINQAGIGRGLQFELFRPGQVVVGGSALPHPPRRAPPPRAAPSPPPPPPSLGHPAPPAWGVRGGTQTNAGVRRSGYDDDGLTVRI